MSTAGGGEWAAGRPVLLGGEFVALDPAGRPDFGRLQQRLQLRRPGAHVVARVPVVFYVFDVWHLGERSLLAETYDGRRTVLAELELGSDGSDVVPPAHVDVAPAQLLEGARAHGLEGIACKRRRSRYDPGRRSPPWIKTALLTTQEVLIGGWTPGKGRRAGTVGALLLGAPAADGDLIFLVLQPVRPVIRR